MFACIHGPGADLPRIAGAFTPWFELSAPDAVVFRVDGLKRLYGSLEKIAQAIARHAGGGVNVSIAETTEAAILAARNIPGIAITPNLSRLEVSSLPIDAELAGTLESWGIYTLDQLAKLPETGIAERFGPAGVHLQRLARGAVDRPLRVFQPEITYHDRIELDHPVSLLEPLLFLISRMLQEQCEKLLSNAMAANEVAVHMELEDKTGHARTLHLPAPMRESKSLLKLLQLDLEAHPPQSAVMAVAVYLKPVPPRPVQGGIFLPATPAPDKLELTLARIRGIVGEGNAGVPELLNTHHPQPFRLVQQQPQAAGNLPLITGRQAFRYFRPPVSAKVELNGNRPSGIFAAGIRGKVITAAGPWRTSGDWWTATTWNRDEWDITLASGVLYRIYREPSRHWFIEGSYD